MQFRTKKGSNCGLSPFKASKGVGDREKGGG